MSKKLKATVTIKLSGVAPSDLQEALNQAVAKILDGYSDGFDSNDDGGYTFKATGDCIDD